MLTILDRQMVFNYLKAYLFCLVSLVGLFIVVDLFMNLEDFTANRKDFASIVSYVGVYYGYKSFQIFDRLCESVILLAGMFTVAWMQRNNELLPLLSAGVSTRRAVFPVLVCASAMMALVGVNQEFALPSIDIFMLENRRNPDGAREIDTGRVGVSGTTRCQSSSVKNGITGCSNLSEDSNATSRFFQLSVKPELSANLSFFNSTYQSQKSCQKKCQTVCAAS